MRATYEQNPADNTEALHLVDATGNTLSIIRALHQESADDPDARRYALAQDTGATVYGGIDLWLVDDDDHGWIYLSPEAEVVLDADGDAYEVELPADEFDLVDRTLRRFLALDGGEVVDERRSR
ncbi:hypothetical protein [Nocardioides sp. GXZ039]|uniref:hypothetical protein n=1 Tax=Nocardioides sp. GXZ039 TaxID=3136018 RepID=UPI0030F3D947